MDARQLCPIQQYVLCVASRVLPQNSAAHGMAPPNVASVRPALCKSAERLVFSLRYPPGICYSWGIMSAFNGDKARFNRERKGKLARRERSQALRRKLKGPKPPRATGAQL